jgi:S-adenosylmethionine hydrolase
LIVTLLTDFGTADYFVGAMKGAILCVNPRATIIDITHEIPAHDIEAGAFTLMAACEAFPAGTVHVAVVDPGVGSPRRAIVAECGGQFFVAPDNGLVSYACERAASARFFHATNRAYFRESVSSTFHGRDVFAPAAAALSNGVAPSELGEEIDDPVRLAPLAPRVADDGTIEARVIHVDHFGNLVTNVTRRELSDDQIARGATIRIGPHAIRSFRRFFADAPTDAPLTPSNASVTDRPFAIWGSAGFLEIAVNLSSAAASLDARRGDALTLTIHV